MEPLRRFNDDRATKEALQEYLNQFIAETAVNLMYERKDTAHIADAHDLINKAFDQINIDYGIQQKPIEQTNKAR